MSSLFGTAAGAVAGKSSGSSGLGYGGSNSSSISTPVSAGGGIGAQTFNLGSLGIGTSGTLGNVQSGAGVPAWFWYAVAGAGALWLIMHTVRR